MYSNNSYLLQTKEFDDDDEDDFNPRGTKPTTNGASKKNTSNGMSVCLLEIMFQLEIVYALTSKGKCRSAYRGRQNGVLRKGQGQMALMGTDL